MFLSPFLFAVRAGWWESVQTRSGDVQASKNTQRLVSLVGKPRRVNQPRPLELTHPIHRCQKEKLAQNDDL
jgi:hypothetical protein